MKNKPILIVAGDPKSIFFEIFLKSIKNNKFKSPIILIASANLLKSFIRLKNYKFKINLLKKDDLGLCALDNKKINLINVNYKNPNKYIADCLNLAFKLLKSGLTNKFINGPINKATFLKKRFLGITEYISNKFKTNKVAMLIYNKDLSVCPLTTHLPIKMISKKINQKLIREKVKLINDFYVKNFGFRPKIALTGLNPHCETIHKFNEDLKIISPAIKSLKKLNLRVNGPFPADTIFLKQNRKKYNVILGMYHDQVLSPIKALKEYDAINITLGLPFYRISPDHGPNKKMINKNKSNPLSLIQSIKFLEKR